IVSVSDMFLRSESIFAISSVSARFKRLISPDEVRRRIESKALNPSHCPASETICETMAWKFRQIVPLKESHLPTGTIFAGKSYGSNALAVPLCVPNGTIWLAAGEPGEMVQRTRNTEIH